METESPGSPSPGLFRSSLYRQQGFKESGETMQQGEAEPEGDWPHAHDDIQIGTPIGADALKAPRQPPFPTTHSDGDRGCAPGGVPGTGADKHGRNLRRQRKGIQGSVQ
jgi:hypothetical protein